MASRALKIDLTSLSDKEVFEEAQKRKEKLGRWGTMKIARKCMACGRDCPSTRDWRTHPCVTPSWFKTVAGQKVIVR